MPQTRLTIQMHGGKPSFEVDYIYQFTGEHFFLSNFCPVKIILPNEDNFADTKFPDIEFDCVENAYQAWKTKDFETRMKMRDMKPNDSKKFAHTKEFPLRDDYTDENRVKIMRQLVEQKFSIRNPDLLQKLLATKDAILIEGTTWRDTFFGIDLEFGYGLNHLGRIEMDVRSKRREELRN